MVSGAISDSDTYVGGPWFVRFRSVVLTVSVRGSYGFGPWFLRFRYGFVPWFFGTVSFRGSEDFGAFSFRDY